MADMNKNPEDLHNVGKGNSQVADAAFVNKGTPASPLAKESDLANAELKEGSKALRTGLIKDGSSGKE